MKTIQKPPETEARPNRIFEKMKNGAAAMLVIGMIGCTSVQNHQQAQQSAPASAPNPAPSKAPAPAPRVSQSMPNQCTDVPEIGQWASMRNLDPLLVRAVVRTQSGGDPCSATKVCSKEAISRHSAENCFPAGLSGASEGYPVAYDEMHDPAGKCALPNAPASENPQWRYLALGLMQVLEPPYTFWPAQYSPTGHDGQYYDVYQRSELDSQTLATARSCNPRFNPFNVNDNLCLGTARMSALLSNARSIINTHGASFATLSQSQKRDLEVFILGNLYSGTWGSRERSPDFINANPGCSSEQSNGDCWMNSFFESMTANAGYCGSPQGRTDASRCVNGQPRAEPPYVCYGYTDFVRFVRECKTPFLSPSSNPGENLLREYDRLVAECRANQQ